MKAFSFSGPHRCRPRYEAEKGNRMLVKTRCAPVMVTAAQLADACDEDGVSAIKAKVVIERLLVQAQDRTMELTLGL